jgi:two-component system chemotaxis response regulator CheB
MINLLIVDDSPTIHQLIQQVAQKKFPDTFTLHHASNGKEAIDIVNSKPIDVIVMDIEMPVMDGLTATRLIMQQNPKPIIVFSAATKRIANLAILSLEAGAVDVVEKPETISPTELENHLEKVLFQRIKIFNGFKVIRRFNPETVQKLADHQKRLQELKERKTKTSSFPIVGIASSTGGPQTLKRLLCQISKPSYPIIIIQHIPQGFTEGFRDWLIRATNLEWEYAQQGVHPKPGVIYVVNENRHLTFSSDGRFHFIDQPPIFGIRPAADYFFDSLGDVYKDRAIGIVLTGMGEDGCKGAHTIKRNNGSIIAEAEEDCIVFGMPKAVIEAGLADKVMKIDEIAKFLNELTTYF